MNTFTEENFKSEVLDSQVPVLVDFWAPWCGPCRIVGPIVEEVAKDLEGKPFKIGKMNVDENQATPGMFGIQSIPTLIVFKDGKPKKQLVGVQTKEKLLEALVGA